MRRAIVSFMILTLMCGILQESKERKIRIKMYDGGSFYLKGRTNIRELGLTNDFAGIDCRE